MIGYTKIETPFERDNEGTKKMIEGRFRNKAVAYLKDSEWVCTEKVDGTNIGIVWDGHTVSYQGRTEKAVIPAKLLARLNELFGGDVNEELFEQKFGEMPVILFGEGYGCGIAKVGKEYLPDSVDFILFDVYLPESRLWLQRDSLEDIAQTFGIKIVPIVLRGTLQDAIDLIRTRPKSTLGTCDMEGVVCKPAEELLDRQGRRIIVKVKVCDFC